MKNILIVEDEERVQEDMSRGIKVVFPENPPHFQFCDNLKEAKHLVDTCSFDLISIDGRFREAEPGTCYNMRAGLALIQHLYGFKFSGHVVFFSGNDTQVAEMRRFNFHGRPIHSFDKSIDFRERQWAEEIAKLLL